MLRFVDYLRHRISEGNLHPLPKKIVAITDWATPKCKRDVQSFLGLAGYYRRFVKHFSDVTLPLRAAVTTTPFRWTSGCQESFDQLKSALADSPMSWTPDYLGPFILDMDASGAGIGGVLSQKIVEEGKIRGRVIEYYSVALTPGAKALRAIDHFRNYLYDKRFYVRIDFTALTWFVNYKQPLMLVLRCILVLDDFDFGVAHRPVTDNADGLSSDARYERFPVMTGQLDEDGYFTIQLLPPALLEAFRMVYQNKKLP